MKSFYLIGSELSFKIRWNGGPHSKFNFFRSLTYFVPCLNIEYFFNRRITELHGMHSMTFTTQIIRIDTKSLNGVGLLLIHIKSNTDPGAIFCSNKVSFSLNKTFYLILGKIFSININHHFKVKPINFFTNNLKT